METTINWANIKKGIFEITEGVGVSVIPDIMFFDKTGIITKGILEVAEVFNGAGGTKIHDHYLRMAIALNIREWGMSNVDKALFSFIGESMFRKMNRRYPVKEGQSFDSSNKFAQAYLGGLNHLTFYYGSPAKLLEKASRYLDEDGSEHPIDMDKVNEKIDQLAEKAMRVIAFGYSHQEMTEDEINDDVTIIGFVAIGDKVRPEAKDAIAYLQKTGVQVVMTTVDTPKAAIATAIDAGLIKSADDIALTSEEFDNLSDEEAKELLPKIRVISRALPKDRVRMAMLRRKI